jgi:hypothetical protein
MGTCKQCGAELTGRADQQFCDNKNRCKMAYWRAQQKRDQAEALDAELKALRAKVRDQAQTIEDQGKEIARLADRLNIERRYLQDKEKHGFKAFLKRQPTTPLIERMLNDQFIMPRDTRPHYEYRLARLHPSEDERQEFTELWKLMLLLEP